ncbi:radical SAM family heme chaperone HemW [Thermoactinomyces mirandus]|uniref:Heme chaperone HemW n=1 Tax=Thermoactinomyces mirandus TaxID=2756294 RepID=A0A7W1XP99_9BACL|nr:radical SAM family heme chaperone HemW [Thermoactinomyces mirandus]MBA4600774.1 oxygen-independent coproporphyrinogen III oxidase [Thermoactinomyces mirandus]
MPPKAIYVHIPFCANKCHYCDFNSYVVNGQPVEDYLDALALEMEMAAARTKPEQIRTIYIGGGTPTILTPAQMKKLLRDLKFHFPDRAEDLEFTVEANPGTTGPELLSVMREEGVNRISFGAQTFRQDLLKKIGRIHGAGEIRKSVGQARKAGFDNISLDLMFGLPTQTVGDVEQSLREAVSLEPEHFSCYSLKVEEGTRFYVLQQQNKLVLPDEDEELEMYQWTRSYLNKKGYIQYEVSNFARPGFESRHNITYWLNEEYYGLGAGAHGYVDRVRYANVKGVEEYIYEIKTGSLPVEEFYVVSTSEDMENYMILGLRLLKGVKRSRFVQRYGIDAGEVFATTLKNLQQSNLLTVDDNWIRLTDQGLLFGNHVFASFLGSVEL